jgi:predicted MPP superfamily phosphohydrolase
MVFRILLFLALILALTIGAHLLLFKAVNRLFGITNKFFKSSILFVLLLLSLSFMTSFFLLRWHENPFTVGFYMFSATWTGIFLNLLLGVAASWAIIRILRFTGNRPSAARVGAVCLVLSLLFSVYGMWNAFHPEIKKIEVEIGNLPDHWKNKIIVQLSDVHLGHFYGTQFLNVLVQRVNTLNPELVFITGDLFDGMAVNIAPFTDGLKQLRAKKGVYFVTGNHETYVGLDRALDVLKKTNIEILHNEAIDIDGLQIIGIGYPGIRKAQEIRGLETLVQNPSNRNPRLLLFHTPTNISLKADGALESHFATYWVPDTSFAVNQKIGVDLQLSGHSHAGQMFPFGYLTKFIYNGYDYGFRRRGRFSIYTTSGVGTWGPPMRSGNSPEIVLIRLL